MLGTGASGPLGSDVLVATAAVRQQFGAGLGRVYAPDVLASFGTGSAQVAIRVVAPDGAATYTASLRADQAARVWAWQATAAQPADPRREHGAPGAGQRPGRCPAADRVRRAGHAAFGARARLRRAAAGASPGLPLRTAYLAPDGPGTAQRPNGLRSLASFLRAQLLPFRPAVVTEFRLPGGSPALRVEFAAPSPLGLLGKS